MGRIERPPADARRAAERRGRHAETLAAWWLRLRGYRVLARRYRTPAGEIDLIARRGRLIAFVEVKSRRHDDDALDAITPAARRRIVHAAETWLSRHPQADGLDLRFDAVLAAPWRVPKHIADIFGADGA